MLTGQYIPLLLLFTRKNTLMECCSSTINGLRHWLWVEECRDVCTLVETFTNTTKHPWTAHWKLLMGLVLVLMLMTSPSSLCHLTSPIRNCQYTSKSDEEWHCIVCDFRRTLLANLGSNAKVVSVHITNTPLLFNTLFVQILTLT